MEILVCRVAWMPCYRSDQEEAVGGGAYVADGNVPHESLNFLPVGNTYYGYVRVVRNGQIRIEKIGAGRGDDAVGNVLVVFCAEDPKSREFLVVGWYKRATVYRRGIQRPDPDRHVSFTADDATLVPKSERSFRVPRSREIPPSNVGGVGMSNVWYGLTNRAAHNDERVHDFREELLTYIDALGTTGQTPKEVAIEGRKRRLSERLERRGNNRQFIDRKGYRCEACNWSIDSIDEDERKVWKSSFELHHLAPVHELRENEVRVVCVEDFAVLCASCHRAIHGTEFVSDVPGFAKAYPRV